MRLTFIDPSERSDKTTVDPIQFLPTGYVQVEGMSVKRGAGTLIELNREEIEHSGVTTNEQVLSVEVSDQATGKVSRFYLNIGMRNSRVFAEVSAIPTSPDAPTRRKTVTAGWYEKSR